MSVDPARMNGTPAAAGGSLAPPASRKILRFALLVFLISLAIRLVWVACAHITPISDFHGYDQLAWNWLQKGHFAGTGALAYRTPGYPGFLAAIYALVGHNIVAATMVQALLGAAVSGLVVLLAARILSPRAALIAGVLHALSPTAIAYVPVLASENLAVFGVVTTALCLTVATQNTGWRRDLLSAVAGGFCGLLLLTRPAALFFLPAWLLISVYSPSQKTWRVRSAAGFALIVAVVLAPWLIRNHRAGLGITLSTTGGINLWLGNNPVAVNGDWCGKAGRLERVGEGEDDARYRDAALHWIWSNPRRYAALCATRLYRMLGPAPDLWATRYFTPTAQADEALVTVRSAVRAGQQPPKELNKRFTKTEQRNAMVGERLRVLWAPLVLAATLLSFARWRAFAPIVLPALCYLMLMSLTFAAPRFRELSNPLLFIPAAALLSDLFLRSQDLGSYSRAAKGAASVLLVVASIWAYASGNAAAWYQLDPLPPPAPDVSECTFVPVSLAGPPQAYASDLWAVRLERLDVDRCEGALRCTLRGGEDTSGGQYGGLKFPAEGARGLRLEVSFTHPENIQAVYVDGYNTQRKRVVRWARNVSAAKPLPEDRLKLVFKRGEPSGVFKTELDKADEQVQEVHVFVCIRPSTEAGLILYSAEVGR